MNYELAKQLKDAGFPQEFKDKQNNFYKFGIKGVKKVYCPTNKQVNQMLFQGADVYKIPTLTELIEACMFLMKPKVEFPEKYNMFELSPNINKTQSGGGKKLGDIENWRAGWYYGYDMDDFDWLNNYFGSTPEEAVAKLWLELNIK